MRKHLYNTAKTVNTEEAWSNYHKIRNEINKEINEAHTIYQEKIFDHNTNSSHKNFGHISEVYAGTILEFLY